MSMTYPQLSREDSLEALEALEDVLRAGAEPKAFPDDTLHPRSIFPGYGGAPVGIGRLREMHRELSAALAQVPSTGRDSDRRFDIVAGQFFVDWFEKDGRGQAANPEIWPYLTILALPDLAVRRFGLNSRGKLPKERFLSGRRNIFYRTYLRSWILGDLLTDPDLPLHEDDLVGLVDRNLSADHRVARAIANQIRRLSGDQGRRETTESRRERVRNGLKAVQYELRVTDLSALGDDDLQAVIERSLPRTPVVTS